jgi:hypothetical protein
MILPFTPREIDYIIAWKAGEVWPDEQRVLDKLRRAREAGVELELSPVQARIVVKWAEEQTSGHYGGGQVRNPEERSIIGKLDAALG